MDNFKDLDLSLFPTVDGQPVARPWIEWDHLLCIKEIKQVGMASSAIEGNKIYGRFRRKRIEINQWLQSPFQPEKDLAGEEKLFGEYYLNHDPERPHVLGFYDEITAIEIEDGFITIIDDTVFKGTWTEPQTRAQFITLFHIATGQYLPLTPKAVKDLSQ